MPERRQQHRPDVLARHVDPVLQQRPDLATNHQRLRTPRAGAVADVLVDDRLRVGRFGMRRQGQAYCVLLDRPGDRDFPRRPAHLHELIPGEHPLDPGFVELRRPVENLVQALHVGIADLQLQEEAIELRLGQRIGPFHLQRILRREHEEGQFELVGPLPDRHALLLHRLEQGRLGLGRCAIDLVGQDDVGEDRPLLELEELLALRAFLDDVGADDVGRHQIGRELHPRELQVQHVTQRVHELRLTEPGNPFQQDVAVREQAGEDAPDDLLIADDALADFAGDEREVTLELFDLLVDFSDHAVRVARRPENSA